MQKPRSVFRRVAPVVDFPDAEARIRAFWRERDIFEKSLALRRGGPRFVFYEGPPDRERPAAQRPRAHARHEGRVPALQDDARLRRAAARPAGTRTACRSRSRSRRSSASHGKAAIEAYGVEPFVRRCIDSVFRYTDEWESSPRSSASGSTSTTPTSPTTSPTSRACGGRSRSSSRRACSTGAQGRLVVGAGRHRALRGRGRQGYRTSTTPRVYVRFPLRGRARHVAAGLDDDAVDAAVEQLRRGERADVRLRGRARRRRSASIVAAALREALAEKLGRELPVERTLRGAELVGRRYVPPFDWYAKRRAERRTLLARRRRRLRHARRRHRHRARRARLRRGRLRAAAREQRARRVAAAALRGARPTARFDPEIADAPYAGAG